MHSEPNSVFQPSFLQNKHAFLTGGSSGICLAVAQRYAEFGAVVSILGRSPEKIEAALRSLGPNARGYPADVRSFDAVSNALKGARAASGEIDFLICGAAGNFPAPALGMSANGFKAVIDIDVLGTFNTCRAAYEYLRKPGGSIINISAAQAFRAMPFQSHVCAAKAGVDMLTRTLALEWGAAGIRVNSVTPGAVDGTEGVRRLAPDEATRKAWMAKTALGRFASPDDIAALCLFLSSSSASYITGAVFVCDGGLSLA